MVVVQTLAPQENSSHFSSSQCHQKLEDAAAAAPSSSHGSCIDTTGGGSGSFTGAGARHFAMEVLLLFRDFQDCLHDLRRSSTRAIPSNRGKVNLGGDGDFPVATCNGEKLRELIGRDPYPLAQESDEAPEIPEGVNHDSAERFDLFVTIGSR
ncbi:heavy metal translocating P-type ATPase [Sesbania bispinosa]|nr:heavy metal translocating P-type ATPase [Sesbania bispinosa]